MARITSGHIPASEACEPARERTGGILASMKRSVAGLIDLNPLSFVLALVDTVLAHTTMLLLTDDYAFSFVAGVGIAAALFVAPQLAATLYHDRRTRTAALLPVGLLVIIVVGLFGARLLVGSGAAADAAGGYFTTGDAAADGGGVDAQRVLVAIIMAFIMCSTAFVGFFARLRVLEREDEEHLQELIGLRDTLRAELRVNEERIRALDPEGVRRAAHEEAASKKRLMCALRDQMREALVAYAMAKFDDAGEDAQELQQAVAQMAKGQVDGRA